MPAAGATGGIPFHGKCPPQARPAESFFTAILTVGGGDRWSPPHFVLIPASYNFPARGANTARLRAKKERGTAKMSSSPYPHPSALGAASTESVIAHAPMPSAWANLIYRWRGPPSPRNTVIFDQVRKALLRIKILCQHNKGSVKLNSDHQNSISRQPPRAAAEYVGEIPEYIG